MYKIIYAVLILISLLLAPSSSAGFFNPTLIPFKNCIPVRAVSGQELISKSVKQTSFVYFNGEGKTIDHILIKKDGLAGYIGPNSIDNKKIKFLPIIDYY